MAKRLWTEEYRPRKIEDYVFQNEHHRERLKQYITDEDLPHLLLTGVQGSGKTTIAEILISELGIEDIDVLRENASNKTGIDYIRETILSFAESFPMGKFKIIKLEEFDRMSQAGQDMLRNVMEANSDTCRFIATGNYEHRITPAMKSRFQHLRFKAPPRDVVMARMAEILVTEEVDFELDILERFVDQAYPDIRKIINNLQLNTIAKKLKKPETDVDGADYQFKVIDLVLSGDLKEVRRIICEQCSADQLDEVYDLLYRNLHQHPKFKAKPELYDNALVILSDRNVKHTQSALPHLNFEAACIELSML